MLLVVLSEYGVFTGEHTKSVLFIDKSVVFQGADPTICLDQVSCSNTFHPPAASSTFVLALSESWLRLFW